MKSQAGLLHKGRPVFSVYDKLAVNYVALWIIANIHYLLKKYTNALGKALSKTT